MSNIKCKRPDVRVKALVILAFLCALFLAQSIAMSETATAPPLRRILDIKISVKPVEMVAPGDVQLSFTIQNPSEYDANNLYITSSDGLYTESLGQLEAGDSLVFTRPYQVSQEELDAGQIFFIISHDDIFADDAPVNYTVSATVIKSSAEPNIEFTRQISSRYVVAGDNIVVTYRVRNSGNVTLSQIRVRDTLGDFTRRIESLEPGATKVLSSRITVNRNAVSAASVSYVAEAVSDKSMTVELKEAAITVVEESLTASLALDRNSASPGETVNGVLTIAAGSVGFTGIAVTDDVYGTIIADALELKPGATITLTCSWPVRAASDYRIRVIGLSATGNQVESLSNTAHVSLTGELRESALSVSASAATPEISRPGGVRVTVAIENSGNAFARNVTLSEETLGEIRTFAFIPTGEPTYRELICDVREDTSLVFSISYFDDAGEPVTVESAPLEIKISPDGALPEVVKEQSGGFAGWISQNVDDAATYFWMLAIAGFVLIVLLVTLVVSHFRERKARRQRLEQEKQRRREEMSRTAKFEPVKRTKQPQKRGNDV